MDCPYCPFTPLDALSLFGEARLTFDTATEPGRTGRFFLVRSDSASAQAGPIDILFVAEPLARGMSVAQTSPRAQQAPKGSARHFPAPQFLKAVAALLCDGFCVKINLKSIYRSIYTIHH